MVNNYRPWQEWEDNYLIENYNKKSREEIAKYLNRTIPSITNRAVKLNLTRQKEHPWTEEEINFMRKNWYRMTKKQIGEKLGRSENAVKVKATRLKFGPQLNPAKWTAHEISKMLNLDVHVVTRWIDRKELPAKEAVVKKIYQVGTKDLEKFLQEHPDKWDSRKCPDLHLEIKRKKLCGPAHWKHWGKKKVKRKIPAHLKDSFVEFVVKAAMAGRDRIKAGMKTPCWLKEKLLKDQELAERRFKKWTPEEDKVLKKLFKKNLEYKKIGKMLGRSEDAIKGRLSRINVWER